MPSWGYMPGVTSTGELPMRRPGLRRRSRWRPRGWRSSTQRNGRCWARPARALPTPLSPPANDIEDAVDGLPNGRDAPALSDPPSRGRHEFEEVVAADGGRPEIHHGTVGNARRLLGEFA